MTEHAALYTRYTNTFWASLGQFGVDIFFVLSGYLITSRLLAERSRSGTFSLRDFYTRRAFRILPAAIVYLATLCAVSQFVRLADVKLSDIASALFFFRNYQYSVYPRGVYTTHFWSLGVEEHFYLLWPAILLWLGNRRSLWFAIAAAIASATWRLTLYRHPLLLDGHWFPSASAGLSMIRTDTRLDGLLLGGALALLLERPAVRQFILRKFTKEMPWLLALLIFINLLRTHLVPTFSTYLLLALMLAFTLVVGEGRPHQWLRSRALIWLGSISYSLYLWNQLFLLHPQGSPALGRFSELPLSLLCVFAAASCSYYLIERPMIALGRRRYPMKA